MVSNSADNNPENNFLDEDRSYLSRMLCGAMQNYISLLNNIERAERNKFPTVQVQICLVAEPVDDAKKRAKDLRQEITTLYKQMCKIDEKSEVNLGSDKEFNHLLEMFAQVYVRSDDGKDKPEQILKTDKEVS